MNYAVLGNGPRPAGYHWVNLVLHEVNVALVYALGMLILGETAPALALAAIWGLHPLLTESVTNIVGRADLLAAFGVLAGLLCHVRGASAAGRRRVAWLAGLAAAQAVGLFSKENAAVLPGIMLLYDLTWPERATWRRRAPAYAAVALPIAAFFYLRSGLHMHMVIEFTENPLVSAGFWTARLTAVKVIGMYLWLFLWPARLSADYSYNAVPLFGWRVSNWEDAKAIIALAVCLGAALLAVLLAVRWRRTGKPLLFFLVFFFVALSPTSNLIVLIGSIMAERFLYLPSVGLAGCVVAAVYALGQRRFLKRPRRRGLPGPRWGWCAWRSPREPTPATSTGRTSAVCGPVPWTFVREAPGHTTTWAIALERDARTGCRRRLPNTRRPCGLNPIVAEAHNNLAKRPGADARPAAGGDCRIPGGPADRTRSRGSSLQPGKRPGAHARPAAGGDCRIPGGPADSTRCAEAHDALANALARMPGRLPEAIAEYQAALRIRPDPQLRQMVDRLRTYIGAKQ